MITSPFGFCVTESLPASPSFPSQEFLKKEFSAENVTFWKACERFQQIPASDTQQVGEGGAGAEGWGEGKWAMLPDQLLLPLLLQLAQEARNIYQEFLSSQALSPVNIDRQAWLGEEVLAEPRPDMFRAQQLQVGDPGWIGLERETKGAGAGSDPGGEPELQSGRGKFGGGAEPNSGAGGAELRGRYQRHPGRTVRGGA